MLEYPLRTSEAFLLLFHIFYFFFLEAFFLRTFFFGTFFSETFFGVIIINVIIIITAVFFRRSRRLRRRSRFLNGATTSKMRETQSVP